MSTSTAPLAIAAVLASGATTTASAQPTSAGWSFERKSFPVTP